MDPSIIGLSCFSALIARTVTHPYTIKIRRQAGVSLGLKEILKNPTSTLKSLYRGYGVAVIFSTPATSIYLSSYELSKKIFSTHFGISPNSFVTHSFSGAIAELLAGMVFTPMEVIKTRMQVNSKHSSFSGREVFSQTVKENGFQGLFRGYLLGFAVFGPYSVVYFVLYEKLKHLFKSKEDVLPGYKVWLASSLSVAIAATISNPMDVVKVRWQMSSSNPSLRILAKILMNSEKNIFLPFFRGSLARVIWLVPSTSITFTLYECLKKYLKV